MRILITAGIFPPDVGGPATYVPAVAEALASRGHEVTVVVPQERSDVLYPPLACPIADGCTSSAPSYRLVRFYRARYLRYANFFVELGRALVTILREARACDVMFVNGLSLPAALASRLVGKPMVVKVVGDGAWELAHARGWTTLDLDEFQKARGWWVRLLRWWHHQAARRARAVIVPSRYLARIAEGWGVPTTRIHVVHNALGCTHGCTHPPHPLLPERPEGQCLDIELPPTFYQGFRLVTVGRLVPHKRVDGIIAALAHMEDATLVIVGDGPHRPALQALVRRLGLEDRVLLAGSLPQEQVWGLLARYADVLVLNSIYEGLPHVLLEAATFGVPVVATAVGGTPEIVQDGETGLLIPPHSPGDLLAALQHLQADPDLRHRLATGARHSMVRFSFERMVEETERVLAGSVNVHARHGGIGQ